MDSRKCVGMDVHQASISIAVRDGTGKLVMESVVETKAATVLNPPEDCEETYGSLSKKEPVLPGCTTWLNPM